MVLDQNLAREVAGFVNPKTGLVDRRIFNDPAIYQLELEQIFARAWLFMCHDSQIPNPGDFFQTTMGEDRVLAVRDREGNAQVLLNSCRHRGNAVCRAEEGNVTSFMCTYHGWTYDLDGKLIGVPGYKEVYHEELDREQWGLIKAAQVDSYGGFIFATMDPEAPSLPDFLGEAGRIGIDFIAQHGTNVALTGVQKYTIPCNWKLAADNVWDWYHVQITHASSARSGYTRRQLTPDGEKPPEKQVDTLQQDHLVIPGEYGHVVGGPTMSVMARVQGTPGIDESWRERPEARAALGPIGLQSRGHPHIFPNMWVTEHNQVSMRYPKGPTSTEVWWFTFLSADIAPELREEQRRRANHTFGPSGFLEQDDGENWGESTKGTRGVVSSRYPLNYSMGLGHGVLEDDEQGPPRVWSKVNEHSQLWYYRAYADWMAATSWADLQAHHTVPEGTL